MREGLRTAAELEREDQLLASHFAYYAGGLATDDERGGVMAAGATTRPQVWASRRSWSGTPEVYFTKAIDNSRLVRVADTKRSREMTQFACALALLFLLVMVYAWQHFSAIEYGYRIEAMKSQRETLVETNRALRLEEASLRDPRAH